MPFAPFKHFRIEYSVTGRGKGLVLVHGTGQSAENTWTETARHFSSHYKVVCPNYSGTGKTQDNNEELTVELLGDQVLAAADHAKLRRFDIVGHSLGTCVAVYLAANHPERIEKVLLLAGFASTGDARSQIQFRMWKEMAETNPELLAQTFLFTAFSPAFVAALTDCAVRKTVRDIFATTDWKGAVRQIELDLRVNVTKEAMTMMQETLVLGCTHDYIVPVFHARKLAELIPNARYAEMETGHGGCVENPKRFLEIADGFLKQ